MRFVVFEAAVAVQAAPQSSCVVVHSGISWFRTYVREKVRSGSPEVAFSIQRVREAVSKIGNRAIALTKFVSGRSQMGPQRRKAKTILLMIGLICRSNSPLDIQVKLEAGSIFLRHPTLSPWKFAGNLPRRRTHITLTISAYGFCLINRMGYHSHFSEMSLN